MVYKTHPLKGKETPPYVFCVVRTGFEPITNETISSIGIEPILSLPTRVGRLPIPPPDYEILMPLLSRGLAYLL